MGPFTRVWKCFLLVDRKLNYKFKKTARAAPAVADTATASLLSLSLVIVGATQSTLPSQSTPLVSTVTAVSTTASVATAGSVSESSLRFFLVGVKRVGATQVAAVPSNFCVLHVATSDTSHTLP